MHEPNASAQGEQSGVPPSEEGGPMSEMIVQTDKALTGIAQVLMKASPEAGKAMMQLAEQFRAIIEAVMAQAQGQGKQQRQQRPQADQMVSPETHGKPSRMAY